ncbi:MULTISPECIES: recombination mediator RecR [Gammaproteobacteria]|uniref:recombination mediator RecR n=1 Tax=Gammaproteobacteria TaxID=1236 RepID=UPI000DD0566F|nr:MULTISPECIES: recombination mediator RecR [Gammaproteobacteria]RTE85990.1 recombination protein RecR [Aliidiomarina sp. B3213]TCZ91344.1 recombination protein RecR [Lysobacter sp. N42]
MSQFSPAIASLIQALRVLPGVGQKSAQRMVFQLLERERQGAEKLAQAITNALERVGRCEKCRTLSETTICHICSNPTREETGALCIVESPADVIAVEQTESFEGQYFVLMGHLSPLDGIGPRDIGLDVLEQRFSAGGVTEVILATNPTAEGDATAHYIAESATKYKIPTTRIAHGIPVGGELEYVDHRTLGHAFSGRKAFE